MSDEDRAMTRSEAAEVKWIREQFPLLGVGWITRLWGGHWSCARTAVEATIDGDAFEDVDPRRPDWWTEADREEALRGRISS